MKCYHYSYFREDESGAMSLEDVRKLLQILGFAMGAWGRESQNGVDGRFVYVVPLPTPEQREDMQ